MANPRLMRTKDNDYVDLDQVAYCPFDKTHHMKKCKLQYHIVKCMKNYTGKKIPCPYNHSEYFEPEELILHLPYCTSRSAVEVASRRVVDGEIHTTVSNKKCSLPVSHRYSDENWGLDD